MLVRIIILAAFAAITGTLLIPSTAEAGSRGRFCLPFGFICQDDDDDVYYEDDERPLTYYEPHHDYYEPRYYEGEQPIYISPKKKKKAIKAAPITKKSVASTKKKAVKNSSVASVEKNAVTERKTANSATGISCDKAGQIVSGYGFASVKPATCTGQVFAFNATRSGKAYIIKLSSASGELTEVQKVH